MNIRKNINELIIPFRSPKLNAIALFLMFALCAVAHGVPITINTITPSAETLIGSNIFGLEASDFCFLADGDSNNSTVTELSGDYDLSPGGSFSSSQMVTSASIGHQWEVYGGGDSNRLNYGICFDFPNDPLGPSEMFSVTVDALFLDDTLPDSELLLMSGIGAASCRFSYHEEPVDPLETAVVHYIEANCLDEVASAPIGPMAPNLKAVRISSDDGVKRVYTTVPEPSTIVLIVAVGLLLQVRRTLKRPKI